VRSPLALATVLASTSIAAADPTAGVDTTLFRVSYDANGLFALEGARLLPKRDMSFKLFGGYAPSPLDAAIPGIGDTGNDRILDFAATIDMAFGMTLTDNIAIGISAGGYRTATGPGYGVRGRYSAGGRTTPSTGLISLRPLSNIDQSANPDDRTSYLGDGLAGPLDARAGLKVNLVENQNLAITLVGSMFLPFGDDAMLLGDRGVVFEPKLAVDWRRDRVTSTRVIANLATRIRKRTVLQAFDPMSEEPEAAKVFLDVGSEVVAGLGGAFEITPRLVAAVEGQVFIPLNSASYGDCRVFDGRRCTQLTATDYFGDAKKGDLTTLLTVGMMLRLTADVTGDLMIGTGLVGARGDDFRVTGGLVWAPQPAGVAAPGRRDLDGDGVPDTVDGCTDEPEDKDGFEDEDGCADNDNDQDGIPDSDDQCANEPEDKDGFEDSDGCPERDNDNDSIPDSADKCAEQAEDVDGFEDEDGCPEQDNDGDGFADGVDKCPNDAETVNGVDDDDGCPDVRGTTGPEERPDRIDLKGQQVTFGKANATLSPQAKQVLDQVATLIKNRKLTIRIEVHVPRTKDARKDKTLSQQRAKAVLDFLVGKGVAAVQLQAVGIGSDRPFGTSQPGDAINDRVDFIKAQQAGRTP